MNPSPQKFFWVLALALFSSFVPLSALPALPQSEKVIAGKLDNGISYYIVSNDASKGVAAMALVQKGGFKAYPSRAAAVVATRERLTDLAHMRHETPHRFLSGNYIWPSAEGFASLAEDAVVYNFRDISLTHSKDVVDSTLLLIFDVISADSAAGVPPGNNAIMVSGDIDAGGILQKMNMLSLLIPRRDAGVQAGGYTWTKLDGVQYERKGAPATGISRLEIDYSASRISQESLPSVLPLVSGRYSREFALLLRRRAAGLFYSKGIPLIDFSAEYIPSAAGPGDEHFILGLTVRDEDAPEAMRLLSALVYGSISGKVPVREYKAVRAEQASALRRFARAAEESNEAWIARCMGAFLYGTSLSSPEDEGAYVLGKKLPDETEVQLFHDYASAMILGTNVKLTLMAADHVLEGEQLPEAFERGRSNPVSAPAQGAAETMRRRPVQRIRIKGDQAEPLSGGRIWTLANGIKVVARHVPGEAVMHFTWLQKGGYAAMPGLKPGEGAEAEKLFRTFKIKGYRLEDYLADLRGQGVGLDCRLTPTELVFTGYAEKGSLPAALGAISFLSGDKKADRTAFKLYSKGRSGALRLNPDAMEIRSWKLDSLLSPGNIFSPWPGKADLSPGFDDLCLKFFNAQAERMGSGILILVGDFDEDELRKDCQEGLASIPGSLRAPLRFRARAAFTDSSVILQERAASIPTLDLCLSAPFDCTVESMINCSLASGIISSELRRVLSDCGWTAVTASSFDIFPQERFTLKIFSSKADSRGFPGTVDVLDSASAVLPRLREALAALADKQLDENRLEAFKAGLGNIYRSSVSDPEAIMQALVLRYSQGKDVMTGFDEKIEKASVLSVTDALKRLCTAPHAALVRQPSNVPEEELLPSEASLPEVPSVSPGRDSLGLSPLFLHLFKGWEYPDSLKSQIVMPEIFFPVGEVSDSLVVAGHDSLDVMTAANE